MGHHHTWLGEEAHRGQGYRCCGGLAPEHPGANMSKLLGVLAAVLSPLHVPKLCTRDVMYRCQHLFVCVKRYKTAA